MIRSIGIWDCQKNEPMNGLGVLRERHGLDLPAVVPSDNDHGAPMDPTEVQLQHDEKD